MPSQSWFDGSPVLNRRFVIYLPSRTKNGEPVAAVDALATGISRMLSERFGGATAYPATGHFGRQQEDIFVIECFCSEESWQASSEYLFSLVKAIGRYCKQEATACSLDGQMLLVAPSEKPDADSAAQDSILADLIQKDGETSRWGSPRKGRLD